MNLGFVMANVIRAINNKMAAEVAIQPKRRGRAPKPPPPDLKAVYSLQSTELEQLETLQELKKTMNQRRGNLEWYYRNREAYNERRRQRYYAKKTLATPENQQ